MSDSFKESHEQIPWDDVYGLRNRIVHDYGMVDLHIIFSALVKDIPELMNRLEDRLQFGFVGVMGWKARECHL